MTHASPADRCASDDEHDFEVIEEEGGSDFMVGGTYKNVYLRCRICGRIAEYDGRSEDDEL